MDDRAELQATIERAQEALADKAHRIEARVAEAKDRVLHAFDLPARYRHRPWPFVLTVLLVGILTGRRWSAPRAALPLTHTDSPSCGAAWLDWVTPRGDRRAPRRRD